jgi:acetyl-CoA C-acetyltransferase
MVCGSGLQAVLLAAQAIRAGEATVVLAGGAESMSNAPFLLDRARSGYRLGDGKLVDVLLRDGLMDPSSNQHMALTAERLSTQYKISRPAQDAFALLSQQNYAAAAAGGRFADEIVPVGKVDRDEHPRSDVTLEKLASLKPSFDPQGTVTAGNSSGINDGAALLILCSRQTATEYGWTPLAELSAGAVVGCDPQTMGLGPVHATRQLCARTGHKLQDFDTIELNEAFAAQSLACLAEWGDLANSRVNPDGGAIALGHPLAASGARLLVHLAHRIRRGETRRGLATLCVGGGQGVAAMLKTIGS